MLSWNQIVDETYEDVYRYARFLGGKKIEAEDLTHDAYEKFFKAQYAVDSTAEAKKILFRIVSNSRTDIFRRTKVFAKILLDFNTYSQNAEFSDSLELQEMEKIISKLPERQRQVFILREAFDYSTEETATLLSISTGSVKTHLSRAQKNLRGKYEKS